MKIHVLTAMRKEYDFLQQAGIGNITICGIGKVNAAMTATELILREKPDAIINVGAAGSISSDVVGIGDLVVGSQVAYHDVWCGEDVPMGCVQDEPARFDANPALLSAARKAASDNVHFGLITSGDQFYWSEEEDKRIAALYPDCLACDMEAAAIAQVCRHHQVPFLSIKMISDIHTDSETQKKTYKDFWTSAKTDSVKLISQIIGILEK